jgi:leucine dehydrogenase
MRTVARRTSTPQIPLGANAPAGEDTNLLDLASSLGFGDIHIKVDPTVSLHAIVAIHDTRLGPALGGCRCIPYPSTDAALFDTLRLARGMTYKAAISGLAQGGGKAVLIRPPQIKDRDAYFESFGRFVEQLGGRYVTAVDSGTSPADMDIVARFTRHVACTSNSLAGTGDPSPHTALGVCRGIEAAVKFKLGRGDLQDVHVALQGVGHVGYPLARELHARGARLTVCDVNALASERCVEEFGASAVTPEQIYDVPCDVFAPCALGAVINDATITRLHAHVVAGAANNQLAEAHHGDVLHRRGILYVPDYVINAGGIIQIALHDEAAMYARIMAIYDTLTRVFEESARTGEPAHRVADSMVESILQAAGRD